MLSLTDNTYSDLM